MVGMGERVGAEAACATSERTSGVASEDAIATAVSELKRGGVVAIPTDTVYGLAASLDHPLAIERIFSIKGRSGTKAIPILVSDTEAFERLAEDVSLVARRLIERFWPGALTIIVAASDAVPEEVRRDGSTVGIRMPNNVDALSIIAGAGGALAVTSANRSGGAEARSADEVRIKLGKRVDYVVDGGPTDLVPPSTVVDATTQELRILRPGAIESWKLSASLRDDSA